MPVALQRSNPLNFTTAILRLQDADVGTSKPLPSARVRVEQLDAAGAPVATLFDGRADTEGKIAVRLRKVDPAASAGFPTLRVIVEDLDGDKLHSSDVQPISGSDLPTIRISVKSEVEKLAAPLGDGTAILGRAVSQDLARLLTENKIDSLAALRRLGDVPALQGFSVRDKDDFSKLQSHAYLQVVSRDHRVNRALISKGYNDVFMIADKSPDAFVRSLDRALSPAEAKRAHTSALRVTGFLSNASVEQRVAKADGRQQKKAAASAADDPLQCPCECQSALSPLAYLADLLDYAVRHVKENSSELTLDGLKALFHQPFGELPTDCSAAETLLNQTRLCCEILRRKANADGVGLDTPLNAHADRTYRALLTQLGTSYDELRLMRSAATDEKEALAARLAIGTSDLNTLVLDAPTESQLATLFGFASTNPADTTAVGDGDLLKWRQGALGEQWRSQDEMREDSILDPDQVDSVWIRDTASAAILPLYEEFKSELDKVFSAVRAEAADAARLEGLLSNKTLVTGGTTNWHALGLDNTRFDAQWNLRRKDKTYDPDFLKDRSGNPIAVTVAELDRLLVIRELFKTSQVDEKDKEEVGHILTRIEKRNHLYDSWRNREKAQKLILSPDNFVDVDRVAEMLLLGVPSQSESYAQWRVDGAFRREWVNLLRVREQQAAALRQALAELVNTVEEAVFPRLRDDFLTTLNLDAALATNTLLFNASASGCQRTTRVAQAIEALQLLIWGLRAGQFEGRLSIDAPDFDDQWKWLGSYATWRSAMFVFLYPENVLLPILLRNGSKEFNTARDIISGIIAQSAPQEEAPADDASPDDEQSDAIQNEMFRVLGDSRPDTYLGIRKLIFNMLKIRFMSHLTAERIIRPEFIYSGSEVMNDRTLVKEYFVYGSFGGAVNRLAWTKDEFELEDMLYLPLHGAIQLQQRGDFEGALDLYRWVYNFPGNKFRFERIAQLLSARLSSFERNDEWLADPLDPHAIAASRSGVDLRFILLSIIRCHLEYADSEFAKDTGETLAKARELYLTAKRLLASNALGEPPLPCDKRLRQLIIEIGETKYRDIVIEIASDLLGPRGGVELTDKQWIDFERELKGILKSRNPQREQDIRRDVRKAAQKYIGKPSAPKSFKKAREDARSKRKSEMNTALAQPETFRTAQEVSVSAGTGRLVTVSGPNTITIVTYPPSFSFCIPPNPILFALRLRTEIALFKLNHCMNAVGLVRPVEPYSAPTDSRSGALSVMSDGRIAAAPSARPLPPTQYRYKTLVERSKQLVAIAQQMEASYLAFIERGEAEAYNLLIARQQLGVARATVTLQEYRVTEANHAKDLAALQLDRAEETWSHFDDLLTKPGLLDMIEGGAVLLQLGAAASQLYLSGVGLLAGFAAGGAFGAPTGPVAALAAASGGAAGLIMGAMATGGQGLSSLSNAMSMYASLERRKQEWEFQRALADIDKQIADAQMTLADDRYNIVRQEQRISEIQADNASDALNFLANKFTSAELYAWMSGIVGSIYRYFLQEATAIAKLAQTQLAFERQEQGLSYILDDYWTYADSQGLLGGNDGSPDRRGMTGSARLLQDISRLDQHAFTTDRRKLQIARTLSLSLLDPVAFAQLRETGRLPFATTVGMFDHDFPGHYLRLVKRVRVSVIALVPPVEGIKATLSTNGISQVVIAEQGNTAFTQSSITRLPESVSLSAPFNATGVFELVEQPDMLLPFEGSGVAASWVFDLPKAANSLDFGTIADVLITFEYTALESTLYRRQVIQELDPVISAERAFSFRQQFADAWYDLNNPQLLADDRQMVVSVETRREDFPPNVDDLHIENVTLYFGRKEGFATEIDVTHLRFRETGQVAGAAPVGGGSRTVEGMISTRRSNGASLSGILGKSPVGEWNLKLPNDAEVRDWFKQGRIEDILFVVTFSGTTARWPI